MKKLTYLLSSLLAVQVASAAVISEFNFNAVADTEGWSVANNISGLTTSGGFLTGTASTNDPQLTFTELNASTTGTWTTLEFLVRETEEAPGSTVVSAFNPIGLAVSAAGQTISAAGSFSATDEGKGFFLVTVDISSLGSANIVNLRLDPIGGASANSNSQTQDNIFEIDYIRLSDNTVVPEPSAYALIGGLFARSSVMLRRRR